MRHTLLACLLVVTLEQPIGHSMDGLVLRYQVSYCGHFIIPMLLVEEAVVNGRTGQRAGGARSQYYPIPQEAGPPSPPQPTTHPDPLGGWPGH